VIVKLAVLVGILLSAMVATALMVDAHSGTLERRIDATARVARMHALAPRAALAFLEAHDGLATPQRLRRRVEDMDRALAGLEGAFRVTSGGVGSDQALSNDLAAVRKHWLALRDAALADAGDGASSSSPYAGIRAGHELLKAADRLSRDYVAAMRGSIAADRRFLRQASVVLIAAGALLIGYLYWSYFLPLREVMLAARAFARGQLSARARRRGSDEVGRMVLALNLAARRTERLVARLEARDRELATSNELMTLVLETAGDGVLLLDGDRLVQFGNRAACDLLGCPVEDLRGSGLDHWLPGLSVLCSQGPAASAPPGGGVVEYPYSVHRADGERIPVAVTMRSERVDGRVRTVMVLRDRRSLALVEAERQRLVALAEGSPNTVATADADQRLQFLNESGRLLTGISGVGTRSASLRDLFPEDAWGYLRETALPAALARGSWQGEATLRTAAGPMAVALTLATSRHDTGELHFFSLIAVDLQPLKAKERELAHRLTHDELTGSLNREGLYRAIDRTLEHGGPAALLTIDLDRFQRINETLGHRGGDALLAAMAERLGRFAVDGGVLSRLSADTFGLLLARAAGDGDLATRVEAVLETVRSPVTIGGYELRPTGSIGVARLPEDARDPGDLLTRSVAALQTAKEKGRDQACFSSQQDATRCRDRLLLASELDGALERDELLLDFQPLIVSTDGTVAGVEALVRWAHPQRGRLGPGQFVPIAEESARIISLTDWVIEASIAQWWRWTDAGVGPLRVSINVSARQFTSIDFVEQLARFVKRCGGTPGMLTLEITETALLSNPDVAERNLAELRDLGFRVALDDFGTGFSSLNYVKRFAVDVVKIDGSFTAGLPGDSRDAAICRAVIMMAHGIGASVVGEGVERAEQREWLAEQGCELCQGFGVARPMTGAAVVEWLAAGGSRPIRKGIDVPACSADS